MLILVPIITLVIALLVVSARGRGTVLSKGILGRGLVLSASNTATETMVGFQRFEVRSLVLDIEVPGRPPYEVSTSALVPRICEAIPGAALDVRVDPKNPKNIAIVGPLGSSAWLPVAAAMPNQTWAGPRPGGSARGCVTAVIATIVAIGAGVAIQSQHHATRPAPPHPSPVHTAPKAPPHPAKPNPRAR